MVVWLCALPLSALAGGNAGRGVEAYEAYHPHI